MVILLVLSNIAIMTYNEVRLADSTRSLSTLVLEYSASIQVQAFNSYTLKGPFKCYVMLFFWNSVPLVCCFRCGYDRLSEHCMINVR